MREAKQFFFEKKNQKTLLTLGHGRLRLNRPSLRAGEAGVAGPPPAIHLSLNGRKDELLRSTRNDARLNMPASL